jgi:prophage antirepressor-like protein
MERQMTFEAKDATRVPGRKIRKMYHDNQWWFPVADVVRVLAEGAAPGGVCPQVRVERGTGQPMFFRQLPVESADGRQYETDCANVEGLLRIIQSLGKRQGWYCRYTPITG